MLDINKTCFMDNKNAIKLCKLVSNKAGMNKKRYMQETRTQKHTLNSIKMSKYNSEQRPRKQISETFLGF